MRREDREAWQQERRSRKKPPEKSQRTPPSSPHISAFLQIPKAPPPPDGAPAHEQRRWIGRQYSGTQAWTFAQWWEFEHRAPPLIQTASEMSARGDSVISHWRTMGSAIWSDHQQAPTKLPGAPSEDRKESSHSRGVDQRRILRSPSGWAPVGGDHRSPCRSPSRTAEPEEEDRRARENFRAVEAPRTWAYHQTLAEEHSADRRKKRTPVATPSPRRARSRSRKPYRRPYQREDSPASFSPRRWVPRHQGKAERGRQGTRAHHRSPVRTQSPEPIRRADPPREDGEWTRSGSPRRVDLGRARSSRDPPPSIRQTNREISIRGDGGRGRHGAEITLTSSEIRRGMKRLEEIEREEAGAAAIREFAPSEKAVRKAATLKEQRRTQAAMEYAALKKR